MDGWDDIEHLNYMRNLGDGVETSKSSYRTDFSVVDAYRTSTVVKVVRTSMLFRCRQEKNLKA